MSFTAVRTALFRFLSVLLLGLLAVSASAAVPRTITHQGYLTDGSGAPLSGAAEMTFVLYAVETGGTALWSETQTVQVNDGIYAAALGSVTSLTAGLIDGYLWLGITVGSDTEMTPRQKLSSVAFALKAASVPDGSIGDAQIAGPISAAKIPDLAALQATIAQLQSQVTTLNTMSAPVALPGSGGSIPTRAPYLLSGSGTEIDGRSLAYNWALVGQPAGSSATMVNAGTSNASFTPDLDGDYLLQLVVNNGYLDSNPATVNFTASNFSPIADAGSNQVGVIGESVTLDGSASSDPNLDPLSYSWSFVSAPDGSSVNDGSLAETATAAPQFVPDVAGEYVLGLTVSDGVFNDGPVQVSVFGVGGLFTDTGQVGCWDMDGNSISCPSQGQPLAQDGSYGSNSLALVDNGNGTVSDSVTNLMWQQSNSVATDWMTASTVCQAESLGGYSDWRLPTRMELIGVVDFSEVPSGVFPVGLVWSSTETKDNLSAWVVNPTPDSISGRTYSTLSNKINSYPVRCVRGGPSPVINYIEEGDGSLVDTTTGLMWHQSVAVEQTNLNWEGAITYCEDSEIAGYNDWRLPNVKEVATIIDESGIYVPYVNPLFTTGSVSIRYGWVSTTDTQRGADSVVSVDLSTGTIGGGPPPAWRKDIVDSYHVALCVRGGN